MSEDQLYTGLGYVLSWLSLAFLLYRKSKTGKGKVVPVLILSLLLQVLYSIAAWYGFSYTSAGGSSLLWLVLLILILGLHTLIHILWGMFTR